MVSPKSEYSPPRRSAPITTAISIFIPLSTKFSPIRDLRSSFAYIALSVAFVMIFLILSTSKKLKFYICKKPLTAASHIEINTVFGSSLFLDFGNKLLCYFFCPIRDIFVSNYTDKIRTLQMCFFTVQKAAEYRSVI